MNLIDISKIKNQLTYEPPEGYVCIYRHICFNPESNNYNDYIGSTDTSIKKRAGKNFKNYHGTAVNKEATKFEDYLNRFGCWHIKSELLYVVPAEFRGAYEQKAIEKYNALELGYNSIQAIIERKTANTRKFVNKANEKNRPTIQGAEDVSLTFFHKDGSIDTATMNAGLYNAKYINKVLGLDHPGIDGSVVLKDFTGKHTTPLKELSNDLGIKLKFGPAGRHTITLDNIYIVGTRTSLRVYLDEHPELLSRVSYLKFGVWEED